jgi:hypothetical protein
VRLSTREPLFTNLTTDKGEQVEANLVTPRRERTAARTAGHSSARHDKFVLKSDVDERRCTDLMRYMITIKNVPDRWVPGYQPNQYYALTQEHKNELQESMALCGGLGSVRRSRSCHA